MAALSSRHALVAGAVGRLGESLLAAVVASPRYEAVRVLVDRPLGSTVAGLAGITLNEVSEPDAHRQAWAARELDVFACWTDPFDPIGRTPNRRDAAYAAITDPDLVAAASGHFGAQCIVVAIDAKMVAPGRWEVLTKGGRRSGGIEGIEWGS